MLLDHISSVYQLPAAQILEVIEDADNQYYKFRIPKRDGGERTVLAPTPVLKLVQRWLAACWIDKFPVHASAMAYRKGVSLLENAAVHKGNRFLLRMDFSHFFPSLEWRDVEKLLAENRKVVHSWDREDLYFFLRAVSRNRRLTIGAASSPSLSNALCYELDQGLYSKAFLLGVSYSRYADDLFFSTSEPNLLGTVEKMVYAEVSSLECPRGLRINAGKTIHSSRKGRMQVTGLLLTPDGRITVGRKRKRAIRAMLHKEISMDADELQMLQGHLAFVYSVEPEYVHRLIRNNPISSSLAHFARLPKPNRRF